jgi:hypothetical protein
MTQHNDTDRHIDAMLLRYLDGACTPEEREHIVHNPALQQRLRDIQRLDEVIREAMRTSSQIADADLVDFAAGTLDPTRALVVGRAVQRDPTLQANVALFREMLADDPFAPDPQSESLIGSVRQIIHLVASAQPSVRSRSPHEKVLYFEGPRVTLTLRRTKVIGEDPSWTLRGVVEYQGEGQPAVVLLRSDLGEHYHTLANESGIFRFTDLFDGVYQLIIVLNAYQQELHLSSLTLS